MFRTFGKVTFQNPYLCCKLVVLICLANCVSSSYSKTVNPLWYPGTGDAGKKRNPVHKVIQNIRICNQTFVLHYSLWYQFSPLWNFHEKLSTDVEKKTHQNFPWKFGFWKESNGWMLKQSDITYLYAKLKEPIYLEPPAGLGGEVRKGVWAKLAPAAYCGGSCSCSRTRFSW